MNQKKISIFALYIAILCMPQFIGAQSPSTVTGAVHREEGNASFYGDEFEGRPTSSGEIYSSARFTAAHRTLPYGTFLIVTNLQNNRQITVKVNDRGPFVNGRIIDLSKAAAEHLGMINAGIVPVLIETMPTSYLAPPEAPPPPAVQPEPPVQPAPSVQSPPPPVQPEPPVEIMMPETIIAESVAPPETPAAASYPPITINVYSAPQVQQVQPPPQPQPLPPPQPQPQPQPPPQPLPQLQPQPQQQPLPPPQPQQFRHRQHHFRERDRERQEQQSPKFSEQVQPEEQPEPLPPLIPAEALPPPPMLPPPVPLTPPDTGIKVVPNIKPLPDSVYRIQVGSFKVPRHAVEAFDKLKAVGLNPSYEPSGEFYRVVIARIPGTEVQSVIDSIAKAGFREVLLREER